jgi:hypothetical protein
MGTIRREKLGKREFTEVHAAQLISGFDFLSTGYGEGEQFDAETARRDWAEHGPGILAEWVGVLDGKEPIAGFGHVHRPESLRPWATWEFDVGKRPDLVDELDILADLGLDQEGDADRHARLLAEREAQRNHSEEFNKRHR